MEREIISKERKMWSSSVDEQIDFYESLFRAEYRKKFLFLTSNLQPGIWAKDH